MKNLYHNLILLNILFLPNLFNTTINFMFFRTGALTSKPLAFRYWSWELESAYIVNLVDGLSEKVWIDLKNKEIIRVLPWLKDSETENWMSDKARFSYDGFDSNWVINFYIKKKMILIPLFYMISVFSNENKRNLCAHSTTRKIINKLSLYKLKGSSLFWYYFFQFMFGKIFFYLYGFKAYNAKVDLGEEYFYYLIEENIIWKSKNSIFKMYKIKNKKPFLKSLDITFNFLNNYLFKRLEKLNFKKNVFLKKFNFLTKISPNALFSSVLINIFNWTVINKHNIMPNETSDILFNQTNDIFYNSTNKKKISFSTKVFLPNLNFKDLNNFRFLKPLPKNLYFDKYDLILTINSNLRVFSPKIFIALRKLTKKNIKIICIGESNFFSQNFYNFGYNYKSFINILTFKHWSASFFKNWKQVGFLIGNNINIINYINKLVTLNLFFKKVIINNLSLNKLINVKLMTLNYWFHLITEGSTNNHTNQFARKTSNIKFFKVMKYKNLLRKNIRSNVYSSFSNWNTKSFKYILNNNDFESKFNFLFESNMPPVFNKKMWDIIFPIVNLLGYTSLYKDFNNFLLKSLFIKNTSNLVWTNYSYIIVLNCLFSYPYFLITSYINNNNFTLKILLHFFFKTNFNFKKKKKLKINKYFYTTKKNIKLTNYKKLNLLNYFQTNFWISKNVYVLNSKYAAFGYNLVSNKKQTFFNK